MSFFLVRSRAVSAKVGNEKDATVFNVLRSADGMQANILSLKSQVEALEETQKSLQKQLGVPKLLPPRARLRGRKTSCKLCSGALLPAMTRIGERRARALRLHHRRPAQGAARLSGPGRAGLDVLTCVSAIGRLGVEVGWWGWGGGELVPGTLPGPPFVADLARGPKPPTFAILDSGDGTRTVQSSSSS